MVCGMSGNKCPFAEIWHLGDVRDLAENNCPLKKYESQDRQGNNRKIIDDCCKFFEGEKK